MSTENKIKILVACEESQNTTMELRKLGVEAYSCDITDQSGGHPEWHIMEDVLPLLDGNCTFKTTDGVEHTIEGKWDMIIAHPPCTDLTVSGARHFEKKRADGRQRASIEFFCRFLTCDCDRVMIENPVGIISGDYIPKWFPDLAKKYNLPQKPTQIVQPWMWGDNVTKTTCLWIRGVEPLIADIDKEPDDMDWVEWIDKKTGKKKRQMRWYMEALKLPPKERSKARSKTFKGMARAMAEQFTRQIEDQ